MTTAHPPAFVTRRTFAVAALGGTMIASGCAEIGQITGSLASTTLGSLIDTVLAVIPGLNTIATTVDAGITAANAAGIISGAQSGLAIVQSGFLALAGFLGVSAATQAAETAEYNTISTALASLSAASPPTTIGGVIVDVFSLISQIIAGGQAAGAIPTTTAVTTPTAPAAVAASRMKAVAPLNIAFQKQYSELRDHRAPWRG